MTVNDLMVRLQRLPQDSQIKLASNKDFDKVFDYIRICEGTTKEPAYILYGHTIINHGLEHDAM